MRRSEQDQKRRLHRETDTPNVGTSRNSKRSSAKGNPIQVPSNSYTEVKIMNKTAAKQKLIGQMHTKSQSRRTERAEKPQPTRASSRLAPARKREEQQKEEAVIEIDSDSEDKPRKRRLIQPDPEEYPSDFVLPQPRSFLRRKTANSPLNITPSKPFNSLPAGTSIEDMLKLSTRKNVYQEYFGNDAEFQNPINASEKSKVESAKSSKNKEESEELHEPEVNAEKAGIDLSQLMLHSRLKASDSKEKVGDKYVIGSQQFFPEEGLDTEEEEGKKPISRTEAGKDSSTTPSPKPAAKQITKRPMSPDPIDNYVIEPTGSDEHILNYPFSKKKSITVYERDFERLEDETYLNDTLIDVFPKIWADEYPDASIYTFSSFFFTKLAGTYSNIHYDLVQRWTSSIDIFKKKYIIIPVAQNNHWFILLVVNPGYCIQGTKGLEYHDPLPDSREQEPSPKPTRRKIISAGVALNPSKPYIMALDPLGLNKQTTAKCVVQYLKKEAITKLSIEETDFLAPEIVMTPCPGQDNFTDCGVFCLHYMKSLYQYPDVMMNVLYTNQKNDERWDLDETLGNFRTVLKRVLKQKMKDYRQVMFSELWE
ncbi:cysteine proteinase [Mucor ambiguus]|uniref:Cysteine proteinase n=1 Tax=Mucor ambiguus TaxID=91626 RepID=A0A0C9MYG0_9FUNG|nr:cysteine proteinase [Mucor ambiguus]